MEEHYKKRGVELNAARLRMATLPTGAEVCNLFACQLNVSMCLNVCVCICVRRGERETENERGNWSVRACMYVRWVWMFRLFK